MRSAFDLYLSAKGFPAGSEVVMSALTIPGMVEVVEAHGLVAVPVDVDPRTLAPSVSDVEAALTEKTCAVVVAHLFGGRVELSELSRLCARRGLPLVEDSAQAFTGTLSKHPGAELALYSFGTLKTRTALGGGVAVVEDGALRDAMRARLSEQPRSSGRRYAEKLTRFLALWALRGPTRYGALTGLIDWSGRDYDEVLREATRGFSAKTVEGRLAQLRQRPSVGLSRLLRRRLGEQAGLDARRASGERLKSLLREDVFVVGGEQESTHWLFAVAVDDADGLTRRLRDAGFDAARGTTSLFAVPAPAGRRAPEQAQRLMERIVFLPAYPEVGSTKLERLAGLVDHHVAARAGRRSNPRSVIGAR